MNQFYDAIYLSAHLDDVALSCGGQIYQRVAAGQTVLIVTVTAGDPDLRLSQFAAGQHASMGLTENPVAIRRQEDQAACRVLGADCLHWDLLDCIYRRDPHTGMALYVSDEDIFGRIHPAESALIDTLAQWIAELPPCDALFAPLALGDHVDHWLVRFSAEKHAHANLIFYEDYPYAQRIGTALTVDQSQAQCEPITPLALEKRIESIAAFHSQVDHLFGSVTQMAEFVRDYVNRVGGELIYPQKH